MLTLQEMRAGCGPVRGIAQLQDLYERNFRQLQRLIPELELPFERAVSQVDGEPSLHLMVVNRAAYTCELRLSYVLGRDGQRRLEPDFWVRVYCDARVAEALNSGRRPPWEARTEGDPAAARFLRDQWERNHMLLRWLDYLLVCGHGFVLADRPRVRVNSVTG